MTSDPGIARRVAPLENDRDALYELLDDFRTEVRTRFDQHEARFDTIDQRFDGVDQRFDTIDRRFDGLEGQLNRIAGTLDDVVRRLPESR